MKMISSMRLFWYAPIRCFNVLVRSPKFESKKERTYSNNLASIIPYETLKDIGILCEQDLDPCLDLRRALEGWEPE